MPAPRLLDKRTVNAEVASQKKQQIDLGVSLAKKVDAIRETLNEEEATLDKFRSETLKKVRSEIDAEIQARDSLKAGNAILREERIKLEAPVDLSQAWEEVKLGKEENAALQERLSLESIEQIARESDLVLLGEDLLKQKGNILKKDELAERNLEAAENKYAQADDALLRAEREAQELLKDAQQRENHLKVREEDATTREVSLSRREEDVATHELDLSNREKKLKSRQELFLKAQNYLKSKK